MGIAYLWDTNTVIYYLQQLFPPAGELFMDQLLEKHQPCISAITEIELMCWNPAHENDLEVVQSFIAECLVIELEQDIKVKTAEIRRAYRLKLPDAIIAATAAVHELTLITRNTSDFQKIREIKAIDPHLQ